METRSTATASLALAIIAATSVFAMAGDSKPPTQSSITEATANEEGQCLMATLTVTRQLLPGSTDITTGLSYLVRDPCERKMIAQGTGNIPNEAFTGDPRKEGEMSLLINAEKIPNFQIAVGTPLVAHINWDTNFGKVSSSKTEDIEDTNDKNSVISVKSETKESRRTAGVSGQLNLFTPKNGLLLWRDTTIEQSVSPKHDKK